MGIGPSEEPRCSTSTPAENCHKLDKRILWRMVSQVNGHRRSREAVARRARNKEIR